MLEEVKAHLSPGPLLTLVLCVIVTTEGRSVAAGNGGGGRAALGYTQHLWLPTLPLTPEAQTRENSPRTCRQRPQQDSLGSLDPASGHYGSEVGKMDDEATLPLPEVHQHSCRPSKQML